MTTARTSLVLVLSLAALVAAQDYLPLDDAGYTYELTLTIQDAISVEKAHREVGDTGWEPERWGPPAEDPLYVFDDPSHRVMYQYLRHDGDSLRVLEFYNNLGTWEELPFVIQLPLEAGDTWKCDGWSAGVTEAGTVTTPAGEFTDCLLLGFVEDEADEGGFRQSWELTLAPYLGPVAETRRWAEREGWSAVLLEHTPHDD